MLGDDAARLDYTAMAATRYGGMPIVSVSGNLSYAQVLYPDIDRRGNILNLLHNDLANRLKAAEGDTPPVQIVTLYQGLPQRYDGTTDIASLYGLFLYGFCTSLLLPVFIANLVTDKQVRAPSAAKHAARPRLTVTRGLRASFVAARGGGVSRSASC